MSEGEPKRSVEAPSDARSGDIRETDEMQENPHGPRADDGGGQERAGGTAEVVAENGGPSGPEPTRYGDWERKGRCIDF